MRKVLICLMLAAATTATAQEKLEVTGSAVVPPDAAKLADTAASGFTRVHVGDMILDLPESTPPAATSGFSFYNSSPWPGGVIPLVFEQGFTAAEFQVINEACNQWSRAANVRCVDRTTQANYVLVSRQPTGCNANVGTRPGAVRMNLQPDGCMLTRIVAHELGHLLGFIHEHQRPDRDQYLDVFLQNVTSQNAYNFELLTTALRHSAYDFGSIMHYEWYGFSKTPGNLVTMWPKNPYGFLGQTMGLVEAPSVSDGQAARVFYGAPTGAYASDRPGPPVLIGNVTDANPVQLSWAPDAHTPQPTLYRLVVSSRPGRKGDLAITDLGSVSRFAATATPGQTYWLSIAGVNQRGGSISNEIAVRVPLPAQQPFVLSASVSGRNVIFSWTGPSTVTLAWTNRAPGLIDGTFQVSGNTALSANTPPGTYYVALWDGARWSNVVTVTVG